MDKKFLKNIILSIVYAIFTLIIVLHHEIWADEAQVWLICKHLNVIELFKHLVNEGHPSFFYLLVMPFAKLFHGQNAVLSMQLICWISSCAAVFLLWQFSPFNKWTKTAITLSAGFLYFFPVIARSYSLIPFVVFLIAIFYPKRHEKPILYGTLILICANIHVIMFGFCAILTLLFFIEEIYKKEKTKPVITGFTIMILGLMAVVLQLSGTNQSNIFIGHDFSNVFVAVQKVFIQFFYNAYSAEYEYEFNYPINLILSKGLFIILIQSIVYLALFVVCFFKNKKMFLVAISGIGSQFLIYILSYNYYFFVNRIFSAHVILIFVLWVILNEKSCELDSKFLNNKFIFVLMSLFFVLTIPCGFKSCMLDVFNNYSSAKDTAEFINNEGDSKNVLIITDNPLYCSTIVVFLRDSIPLHSIITDKDVKYVYWDKTLLFSASTSYWKDYIENYRNNESKKKIYIVIPNMIEFIRPVSLLENAKPVFKSRPCIFSREQYSVYEYID